MKFTVKQLMVVMTVIAMMFAAVVSVKSVLEPRFVASSDHPNGSRVRIVQTFSIDDLFNTAIYFDDGDGRWRWYYYDHDDWYWGNADSRILGSEVHLKSATREVMLNVETGECTIQNNEFGKRTTVKSTIFRELPKKLVDRKMESHTAKHKLK